MDEGHEFGFKDYNEFVKKYGPIFSGSPSQMAIPMISNFFEGVGILLHEKLIDISLVDGLVKPIWEKIEPVAEGLRRDMNEPKLWEYFEYLYNEMEKREQTLQST